MKDRYWDDSALARAKLYLDGVSLWWARSGDYGPFSSCVL